MGDESDRESTEQPTDPAPFRPYSPTTQPTDPATEGVKPLEGEVGDQLNEVYPPDIDPTVEVGGTPEQHQMLDEEMDPDA